MHQLAVKNSPGPGIISFAHGAIQNRIKFVFTFMKKHWGAYFHNLMNTFLKYWLPFKHSQKCLHYFASRDMDMLLVCYFGHG